MLSRDMRSHHEASSGTGSVFMDRAVTDVLGYMALCGLTMPDHALRAALAFYSPLVLLAPHWNAIFTQDAQKRQDAAEAEATSREMARIYTRLGYKLMTLPLAPVQDSADFVMRRLPA